MFDIKPEPSFGHDTAPYQGANYEYYGEPYSGHWWDKQGPHRGIGPKNYHRADDKILADINDRLWLDGQLDARNVEVHVADGQVTLTGDVPNRRAKRAAEGIAESVPGVRDVQNQLRINNKEAKMANSDLWQNKIKKGMIVVDSGGTPLGAVKDLGEDSFWLDREANPDTRVSYDQIQDVVENFVRLKITGKDLQQTGIAEEATPFKPVSAG